MSRGNRQRPDDHLVEPLFGALHEPAPAQGLDPAAPRDARREPLRRLAWIASLALAAAAAYAALA